MHAWGLPVDMLIFGGLAIMAVVFVNTWMPETRGLPVEEISTLFERTKGHESKR